MTTPTIQWYPGHIAKAEKQLKEKLKLVDVVLEVRDARIPLASHHPDVTKWIGSKPRILILNRLDMIPKELQRAWRSWFEEQGEQPYFTNGKTGEGIKTIENTAQKTGVDMNQRRRQRGMLPRPVRAVVMGLPNVGKSALINRLVGKKAVKSERRAGVTRQLHWVRISDEIELLDAPGVIPWRLENQLDAVKLAICEDIGDAAYDNQRVASVLVDLLVELNYDRMLTSRYNLNPQGMTGEEYLFNLGENRYRGETERAARQLLHDFRTGVMGKIALELVPTKIPVDSTNA
jgi:ribosome biogenesis GTPase A